MQVWNLLHAVRWKYWTQKSPKISHLGTIAQCFVGLYLRNEGMHRQSEKKLVKRQYLLYVSSQYVANFGPLTAEIGSGVWGTLEQISTGFASCLRYCSDVAHRRPTELCTMFGRLMGWYTIYTFSGTLVPWRSFARCNITVRPRLAFACKLIGRVTARQSSSGRQPKFVAWYKEWNYGTFAEGAIYIRPGGHHVGHRPTL